MLQKGNSVCFIISWNRKNDLLTGALSNKKFFLFDWGCLKQENWPVWLGLLQKGNLVCFMISWNKKIDLFDWSSSQLCLDNSGALFWSLDKAFISFITHPWKTWLTLGAWSFSSLLNLCQTARQPNRLSHINALQINLCYIPKDQSLKFLQKNIENWQSWKSQFFWIDHFDFFFKQKYFFASSLPKSVTIYVIPRIWQNFVVYSDFH